MCGAERVIEIASYTLIAAFGIRLVWTKGGSFIGAARSFYGRSTAHMAPVLANAAALHPGHDHHPHDHDGPGTIIIIIIIITTMPRRTQLSCMSMGPDMCIRNLTITTMVMTTTMSTTSIAGIPMVPSLRNRPVRAAAPGLSAVCRGIRPCSGAILVLVFALAQGLFWAGTPPPS